MKPVFKEIGEYTKRQRLALGLSQGQLARKLGYSNAQFVSNVERGLCNYPLRNLKKLERILQIDLPLTRSILVGAYESEVTKVFFPQKREKKAPSASQ